MQPSPYTPGEIASSVPGRMLQLSEFEERLSYLVDLQKLIGRIRVDHAPRGLGKTSLLRQYQRRADERGVFTVWVTAGEEAGLVTQIASRIQDGSKSWSRDVQSAVRQFVENVTVSVGVPGVVKLETTSQRSAAPPVPSGVREFEDLIRATANANGHQGLIIFIDEIQAADPAGLRTIAFAWQHLQSEGTDVPAAVFAAGLPDAADKISSVVTFTERLAFRPLDLLEPDAEEIAISAPARALGVSWSPDALAAAVNIAQGYPYSIQLIADASWAAARHPDPGGEITREHVEQGRVSMQTDLTSLFRARWANATPSERDLMTAMAEIGDGSVKRSDVALRLGVTPASLSVPRGRLIDKGFIHAPERGHLAFTVPGFAAFVRELDD
jgi:hypothetical protein